MRILVVRHAIAEERAPDASFKDDAVRALTKEGRKKMRAAARGLGRLVETLDLIASSPLVRARQTAEIVGSIFGSAPIKETKALCPGADPEELARWIKSQGTMTTVCLVGHEPDLSDLIGWFTTGEKDPVCLLKKGAACLLEFPGAPGPGRAAMVWLLQPSQLRLLS